MPEEGNEEGQEAPLIKTEPISEADPLELSQAKDPLEES